MAVATPVVTISAGTSGVQVTTNQDWNALMYQLSSEKTKMDSMFVWSDNPAQLTQPFSLINIDPNGNDQTKVITPKVDAFQKVSQIDFKALGFDGTPFRLDGQNRIDYTVLPYTNTRLVVFTKDDTSVTTQFLKETGIVTDFPKIIEDLGVEINFSNMQSWKEELPVIQKPVQDFPKIVQKDYLTNFLEQKKSDKGDDYMHDEMKKSMDAIRENTKFDEQLGEDTPLQEALNTDGQSAPEKAGWANKKIIIPVGIGLLIVAGIITAVIINRNAKGTH